MSRATPRFRRINPSLPAVGSTNGVVVYKIVGSIEGQLTISTFMYSSNVNQPSPGQLTTLLTNISGIMWTPYHNVICSDWTTTRETLDVVHRNDLAGSFFTGNATLPGTRPAGHLPTEVAVQLIRYSAVKGQHGRGRVSIPAISTADVTASNVTGVVELANLNTFIAAMLTTTTDGTGNTYTPCIGQRSLSAPKLVVGFSAVVRVARPTLLGTIRRRKIGRGK